MPTGLRNPLIGSARSDASAIAKAGVSAGAAVFFLGLIWEGRRPTWRPCWHRARSQPGFEHSPTSKGVADAILPVSARASAGIRPLVDHLVSPLPLSAVYFEPQRRSDQPQPVLRVDLVREQVVARTLGTVPHTAITHWKDVSSVGRTGLSAG